VFEDEVTQKLKQLADIFKHIFLLQKRPKLENFRTAGPLILDQSVYGWGHCVPTFLAATKLTFCGSLCPFANNASVFNF